MVKLQNTKPRYYPLRSFQSIRAIHTSFMKAKFLNCSLVYQSGINFTLILKTLYMCSIFLFKVISLDPCSKAGVKLVWFIVSFPKMILFGWTNPFPINVQLPSFYASRCNLSTYMKSNLYLMWIFFLEFNLYFSLL